MMDFSQLAVLGCIAMVSATVMSLAGFGFGLVSMSFFPLFMQVAEANVVASLLAIPVIVVNLVPIWRSVRLRALTPVLATTALGTPLGIWGLARLDERVLLVGLGSVIMITLVVNELAAKGKTRSPSIPAALGAGFIGGMFGGAYSISGPPVLLYLTSVFEDKHALKANIMLYFLLQICLRFIFLVAGGIATTELMWTALLLLLPLAIGVAIGMALFNRIQSGLIRRITQVLLAISSVIIIIKAL